MRFSEFGVGPGKVEALRERIGRLGVDLSKVDEKFIRGGGKGGQKINKTANCVQLSYEPMSLVVRCQRDRRRSVNRFLALRQLVDEIEFRVSPATSERGRRIEKIRATKAKARKRSRAGEEPESEVMDGGL